MEDVDYLFVDRALAGLRSDSVGDVERVENRLYDRAMRQGSAGSLEKGRVEALEK